MTEVCHIPSPCYDYAVSREDKNAAGQKMYIQTKMAEYAEELWEMMQDEKTHVYMCGLKGMESGMAECFGPIAEKNGIVWTEFAKAMKKAWPCHAVPHGDFYAMRLQHLI